MFEDIFTVKLSGWTSDNPPLSYTLWGVTSTDPLTRLKISSTGSSGFENGSATITKELPMLVAIQAEISDAYGEKVTIDGPVSIVSDASTNWLQVVDRVSAS